MNYAENGPTEYLSRHYERIAMSYFACNFSSLFCKSNYFSKHKLSTCFSLLLIPFSLFCYVMTVFFFCFWLAVRSFGLSWSRDGIHEGKKLLGAYVSSFFFLHIRIRFLFHQAFLLFFIFMMQVE